MSKHEISTNGDSYLYFFVEEGYKSDANPFFKIGIVTHALTDETVKGWPKYLNSPFPVSIQRRLSKLNNGNPRSITSVAYFRFKADETHDALQKSRAVETAWKRKLREAAQSTPSPEWFKASQAELHDFINQVIEGEAGNYSTYWYDTPRIEENLIEDFSHNVRRASTIHDFSLSINGKEVSGTYEVWTTEWSIDDELVIEDEDTLTEDEYTAVEEYVQKMIDC
jgi:hypothetical protein